MGQNTCIISIDLAVLRVLSNHLNLNLARLIIIKVKKRHIARDRFIPLGRHYQSNYSTVNVLQIDSSSKYLELFEQLANMHVLPARVIRCKSLPVNFKIIKGFTKSKP